MIKHVFLDLDDTLLDFGKAEAGALKKALSMHGVEPRPELCARYSEINNAQWTRLERGELTRRQVLLTRFELLFAEFGIDADAAAVQEDYERLLGIGHYFIDGAPELLEALKDKYRLYIASNGTASVQAGRIKSAGIAPYFDGIFISEHLGADKPSREFFEACFARIENFDKNECVMVGDRLSSDILGGKNAGIKTCRFNPKSLPGDPDIVPDAEIKSLAELPALLEKM